MSGSGADPASPPMLSDLSGADRLWVIFDGRCRVCRASVRLLRALDWLGRLRFLDLHTEAVRVRMRAPVLTHEQMMRAMHLATPCGRVYAGFYALRRAARVLPAMWPVLPLLYVPGMARLGPAVYAWIARRRYGRDACPPDGPCRS